MTDEGIILTPSQITAGSSADVFNQKIELPDNDPVAVALGLNKKEEPPQTSPATEKAVETKPADATATPQPTPPTDGTVKPEAKPDKVPYTDDELKALAADPNATLDTSRLDGRGQVIYKEFQRGFTKKFEELKREREEVDRRRQEITAFEQRQRQLEDERKYREETEQFGEEEAKRLKELRDIKTQLGYLQAERQAFQQREAAETFRREFNRLAPTYNVPITQEMEDMTMSYLWANNKLREANGQPLMVMDDGIRIMAEQMGITNFANLEKIINANPQNREALEQKIIADYLKKKAVGPTVVSSTQAPVNDAPPSAENAPFDQQAYLRNPEQYMIDRVTKIFEEKNLKINQ